MQNLSRSPDVRSPRALAASADRRAWLVRFLMPLMLALAGLLWLMAPVMAATTPADPACVSAPQACVDGASLAAQLDAADADHGELADLDALCAELPVLHVVRTASRREGPVALAVSGVQPWLPPPRRLG